jgi:alkanesulfonate monooxygenase SsuD/methylene tetrahydromethanopterin reductase-like flavin-dependent oxidoreductase (luciferase family)
VEAGTRSVEFGLFDWIDVPSAEHLGALYEQRLRLLEYADAADFYCYHLAEHHMTPLGGAPSPSVFLAAAAQRTSRIRLGTLVYVLPLHHPLRLAEEICMLDHLSRGRMQFGWGRGASPWEQRQMGADAARAQSVDAEALELILEVLATGGLESSEKKHFDYPRLQLALRPLQQPYPPLWHPATRDRAEWLGRQAVNAIVQNTDLDEVRARLEAYAAGWRAGRGEPGRLNGHEAYPRFGLLRQLYLAETHERAMREARSAHAVHGRNWLHLFSVFGGVDQWAPQKDFEKQLASGGLLVGTPSEVGEQLALQLERSGVNYLSLNFTFGDLTDEQVMRSITLFAEEVRPRLGPTASTFVY